MLVLRGRAPWLLGAELACPDHCRQSTESIRARRACKRPGALPVLAVEMLPAEMRGEVTGGLLGEECTARSLGCAQEYARTQEASSDRLPKTVGQVRL